MRNIVIEHSEEEYQNISFSVQDIEKIKSYFGLSAINQPEFSNLFVVQLFISQITHRYNIHTIVDEIKVIEGIHHLSMTKSPTKFKRLPLQGLWHTHHFQSKFVPKNISSYWGFQNDKTPKFDKMIDTVFNDLNSEYVTDEALAKISHKIVFDAYQHRVKDKQITGEWIIFAKHEGRNYYLTLASHKEGDQNIYNRIVNYCSSQFPFLFDRH